MALTSTTLADLSDQTQTLTFYEGATKIDQIVYNNNLITYSAISAYDLSSRDAILYFKYLNAFNILLYQNFPVLNLSANYKLPLSSFTLNLADLPGLNIIFKQSSHGVSIYNTHYTPANFTASYESRPSVTVTVQEFFISVILMAQYTNQITLNS